MTTRRTETYPTDGPTELPQLTDRPLLRGWIHLFATPVVLILGLLAVTQPEEVHQRISVAVFTLCSVILFGSSAVYHLGNWTPRVKAVLRRVDHSNIFLLIAGTYTPLAVLLLDHDKTLTLLVIIWSGALAGITIRQLWLSAPRWVYVAIYLLLGWVAIWYLPDFYQVGGAAVVWFIILGGVFYTLGAVSYGLKWPNPMPRVFGFHEIFHLCTIVAWACHATAVAISW